MDKPSTTKGNNLTTIAYLPLRKNVVVVVAVVDDVVKVPVVHRRCSCRQCLSSGWSWRRKKRLRFPLTFSSTWRCCCCRSCCCCRCCCCSTYFCCRLNFLMRKTHHQFGLNVNWMLLGKQPEFGEKFLLTKCSLQVTDRKISSDSMFIQKMCLK